MVVSLNYCSQNGGNLYRAPYYNGNPNIGPRIMGNLDQSPWVVSRPLGLCWMVAGAKGFPGRASPHPKELFGPTARQTRGGQPSRFCQTDIGTQAIEGQGGTGPGRCTCPFMTRCCQWRNLYKSKFLSRGGWPSTDALPAHPVILNHAPLRNPFGLVQQGW